MIINHFQTEETFFNTFNYDEAKRHREVHSLFLESLEEPKEKLLLHNNEMSTYIIKFLNDWAKNHISSFDLTFAEKYREFNQHK